MAIPKKMAKVEPKPPKPMSRKQLAKSPTGIQGLDEITGGGLPKGRPTLVCGGTGCGKTLLAMEFLVRGATQYDEPGVFIAFEETAKDLTENVTSLGFDLKDLITRKKMVLDYVYIEPSEVQESGEYDLEGLFIRLGQAIDSIGAKRVAIDTIESLSAGLPNPLILRAELRRLFRWLKDKGVTAVITGERSEAVLSSRESLEAYVSDCVIVLDHRVADQVSSRRLRVVKYRGSTHGTNEYPFLIDEDGISVLPITSLGLHHTASAKRVPSGIARLDAMLGGPGFFRGSSVLVSGTSGTGKTSLAAHFALAACQRGERVLYLAFEESPSQIILNMRSLGMDLEPWVKKDLLLFQANRPTFAGLETHLAQIGKTVRTFNPQIVIVDPLSSFVTGSNEHDVKAMLMRLVDLLKMNQCTSLLTSLTPSNTELEKYQVMASLIDTWLMLSEIESGGERNRGLSVIKSRGTAHSNQIRELLITDHGIDLLDVYVGPSSVLTGSARMTQEAHEKAALLVREQEVELRRVELERQRVALEAQIAVLRAEFAVQEIASAKIIGQEKDENAQLAQGRVDMGLLRKADEKPVTQKKGVA